MARKATKKAAKKAPAKKKSAARKSAPKKAAAPAKAVKVTAVAGKTVTASALLQSVADHLGVKKSEAKALTEGYLDVVKAYVLKGSKVKIGDIGMVMVRHRKARMGRNPATGESIKIPAKKVVKFRVAKAAKDAILTGK